MEDKHDKGAVIIMTGRGGGLHNGRGRGEALPLRKGGGAENVLAMLRWWGGGGTQCFGVVFTQ